MVYRSIGSTHTGGKSFTLTTPAVRKIAKENNIDLATIQGSGPNNRILKEDILNYLGGARATTTTTTKTATGIPPSSSSFKPSQSSQVPHTMSSAATSPIIPLPPKAPIHSSSSSTTTTTSADRTRVPIRGIQRQMVKSMSKALEVQHLTYSDEIIVDKLREFRDDLRKDYDKRCKKKNT
jgi:2-oxoisovalerate dehydrogenase E2 component (dihydrolipoyl transacylase)